MKNLLIIFAVLLLLLTLLSAFGGSISYKESFMDGGEQEESAAAMMYDGGQVMASDSEAEAFSQFGPVNTEAISNMAQGAWSTSKGLLDSGKDAISNMLPTVNKYQEVGEVEPFEENTYGGQHAAVELF